MPRKTSTARQTCSVCRCVDKFNFHVPNDLWHQVVPARYRNRVVCLECFDEFASKKNVDYSGYLNVLYFVGDQATLKFETVSVRSA
ncbi:MAG TPA: hypothetical protein VNL14_01075 [Candidatus Acidoferrales bacterium]|nr:hypothetical protein [Candidatus Acidoferrales bacterium]